MKEALALFLEKHFDHTSTRRPMPGDLTVGVEHEFFLLNREGEPTNHEGSQAFLRLLSQESGWHVQETEIGSLGPMINRVSNNQLGPKFIAIKYDHHPHLLEIAFTYHSDLHGLHREVSSVFQTIARVATECELKLSHLPILAIKSSDPRVVSPLRAFQGLRDYRSKLMLWRDGEIDKDHTNYAATIAATQVHIGGLSWWRNEGLVSRLYSIESELLTISARGLTTEGQSISQFLEKRWEGYRKVFKNYPLVGFPDLRDWTTKAWIDALTKSPVVGDLSDDWSGRTLTEIKELPFKSWETFFKSVRDLQIIRPRLFGTLEFRADPSQPTVDRIVAVAALRLAVCIGALSGEITKRTYSEARTSWWEQVTGRTFGGNHDNSILDQAARWLKLRAKSEETFLGPLYDTKTSNAA
jgi:hypothetical protein